MLPLTCAVTLPGYGTVQDANGTITAELCPPGFHSAGGNQLPCVSCPANMTTQESGATAVSQCGEQLFHVCLTLLMRSDMATTVSIMEPLQWVVSQGVLPFCTLSC
jgi:hypothetical protein